MSEKPWFPLYVGDFLLETQALTPAQTGAYIRLLAHYWERLCLPDDDHKLARIAGMRLEDWRRNRGSVAELFQPGWRHTRLDCAHRRWLEKANKCKDAAVQMHSKRRANVYAFAVPRARATEVEDRNKNHRGESESSSPVGDRGYGGKGETFHETFQQGAPPLAAEQERGKRPDELTRAEFEDMLAKRR